MYTAVIPVKKNSSRLLNKNILDFGDSTLLEHKINQLKKVKKINKIIVSSDSELMIEIAKKNNVEGILRPTDLANETRPLSDFFDYITTIVNDGYLVWACCTSPLFDEKYIKEAIHLWDEKIKFTHDSLITVYKFQHYLMDENGPMNYSLGNKHQNSQELKSYDLFTNGLLIAPISSVKKWRYNYGPNAYRFNVDQIASIDIDTKADYYTAKSYYKLVKEKK